MGLSAPSSTPRGVGYSTEAARCFRISACTASAISATSADTIEAAGGAVADGAGEVSAAATSGGVCAVAGVSDGVVRLAVGTDAYTGVGVSLTEGKDADASVGIASNVGTVKVTIDESEGDVLEEGRAGVVAVAVVMVGLVLALMTLASVVGAGMSQLNHDEEEEVALAAAGLK